MREGIRPLGPERPTVSNRTDVKTIRKETDEGPILLRMGCLRRGLSRFQKVSAWRPPRVLVLPVGH